MPPKYKSFREPLLELDRILNAAWEEHGLLVDSARKEETDPSTAIKASEEIGEVVEQNCKNIKSIADNFHQLMMRSSCNKSRHSQ